MRFGIVIKAPSHKTRRVSGCNLRWDFVLLDLDEIRLDYWLFASMLHRYQQVSVHVVQRIWRWFYARWQLIPLRACASHDPTGQHAAMLTPVRCIKNIRHVKMGVACENVDRFAFSSDLQQPMINFQAFDLSILVVAHAMCASEAFR